MSIAAYTARVGRPYELCGALTKEHRVVLRMQRVFERQIRQQEESRTVNSPGRAVSQQKHGAGERDDDHQVLQTCEREREKGGGQMKAEAELPLSKAALCGQTCMIHPEKILGAK